MMNRNYFLKHNRDTIPFQHRQIQKHLDLYWCPGRPEPRSLEIARQDSVLACPRDNPLNMGGRED
jgi:hypothetical protein